MGEEGNKWPQYAEQLDARFAPFCAEFEDELEITDGPSIIEGYKFDNFRGVHIIGAAGLLNVLLRALLAREKNNNEKALSVLVESQRVRRLFFVHKDNAHELDVLKPTTMIRIHPFTHPNHHQCFLTDKKSFSEEDIHRLDRSYSEAHRYLGGIEVSVEGGGTMKYKEALAKSNFQRYELRLAAKNADIDQEEADKLRRLEDLNGLLKKKQTFEANQQKKKQREA